MRRLALGAMCVALLASPALAQTPLGTSFTYQGRLVESGSPPNGTYDFRFILYDAPSGGNQVGPTVTRDDVFVSTGLFTVGVDFGAVFTSQRRFLEVGVRPGASTGAYDVVSGRQELTAAPSALFGASAPWTGVTGKPAGFADNIDNDLLGGLVCPNGQVAKSNGSSWACGIDSNTTYMGGFGISVVGTVIAIAAAGVTTSLLADDAVTAAKIAAAAVGSSELADNTVSNAKLQNFAVTASKIATGAVGTAQVAPDAITRSGLSGVETALYRMAAGCGDGGKPTFASQCLTIPCGGTFFNDCAGNCTPAGPVICNNSVVGYLLANSIP